MHDSRYRLEEPIAAGGTGQVWRGTDLLLQRPVAVKVLRPEYCGRQQALARFRAEARHAGALPHPGIAQVYDYCDGGPDSSPCLVMELVQGPSLAGVLAAGAIDAVRTLDIIAQAAAGLAAAHRAGLVHRDIKPANILLTEDGLVKITDFGIAYAAGSASVTDPELVMGTAQYLAPERITGGPGTPASDLYSLGIVLYECLVGRPPFDGTIAEVISAHLHRELPPLPPAMSAAIGELLAGLTAKDPSARLADAAELAATAGRLSAALAAAPLQPPAQREARPARNLRRRLLVATLATAVLAVLAALSGWLATSTLQSTTPPRQAAPGASSHQVAPSPGTAGPSRGTAGISEQHGAPDPAPSPHPSASLDLSPRQTGSPSGQAGQGSTGTPKPGPVPGSASSSSGVVIQLSPLPSITISLGL